MAGCINSAKATSEGQNWIWLIRRGWGTKENIFKKKWTFQKGILKKLGKQNLWIYKFYDLGQHIFMHTVPSNKYQKKCFWSCRSVVEKKKKENLSGNSEPVLHHPGTLCYSSISCRAFIHSINSLLVFLFLHSERRDTKLLFRRTGTCLVLTHRPYDW